MDVRLLAETFRRYGYTWKIGGVQRVPSQEDLEATLDVAKKALYAEPVPSQLEIGRLIVRHTRPGKFEVYLFVGDHND